MIDRLLKRFKSADASSKIIILLLLLNILRGVIYVAVVPLWQAPDEPEHFINMQMVAAQYRSQLSSKIIAPAYHGRGAFSLYDYLLLPFYFLFADLNLLTTIYLLRLVSVILSTLAVYLTYRVTREVFPGNLFIILGAPLFVSFLPMFTHISSTIQPDNLANVTFAFFIFCAIKLIRRGINIWYILGMIAAVIASLYTRRIAFVSLPLALLIPAFLILRTKSEDRTGNLTRYALLAAYLIPLFFSYKLIELASTKFAFARIDLSFLSKMLQPAFIIQTTFNAFSPAEIYFRSFWAVFSWLNVPVSESYYNIAFMVSIFSLAGLSFFLLRRIFDFKRTPDADEKRTQFLAILFLLLVAFIVSFSIFSFDKLFSPQYWPQGRRVFIALAALAPLFVAGLGINFDSKRFRPLFFILLTNLFLFDFACLFGYIIPRFYADISSLSAPRSLIFGGTVPLNRYVEFSVKPGILNHDYFYYFLFLLYLITLVALCWSVWMAKPDGTADAFLSQDNRDKQSNALRRKKINPKLAGTEPATENAS